MYSLVSYYITTDFSLVTAHKIRIFQILSEQNPTTRKSITHLDSIYGDTEQKAGIDKTLVVMLKKRKKTKQTILVCSRRAPLNVQICQSRGKKSSILRIQCKPFNLHEAWSWLRKRQLITKTIIKILWLYAFQNLSKPCKCMSIMLLYTDTWVNVTECRVSVRVTLCITNTRIFLWVCNEQIIKTSHPNTSYLLSHRIHMCVFGG